MITPFDDLGRINLPVARQLVDFLIDNGIDGLVPAGTTGEGLLLSLEERRQLCEAVVEQAAGRVPVLMHTGCITTADTILLTQHAQKAGADGAAVITPYFYLLDDLSLFDHYVAVARAVPDFPISIYCFPRNAQNDISLDLFLRLRDAAPNIFAIKMSTADFARIQEYVEASQGNFSPLCGADGLALAALSTGAPGLISGNANAFPEQFRALYDSFLSGEIELARQHQRCINQIRSILKDGLHPAYFKAVLSLRSIPAGRVRPPMRELTAEELAEMEESILQLGLL